MKLLARIAGALALAFLFDTASYAVSRTNPDPALPFVRPGVVDLGNSTKKVFAHYMTGDPLWLQWDQGTGDYYADVLMYAPNATEDLTKQKCYTNDWRRFCSREWGGSQRERPLRPSVNPDPTIAQQENARTFPSPYVMAPVQSTGADETNLREEIYRAISIGIDGFGVAIFDHIKCDGTASAWFSSFCRTQELLRVAAEVNAELGTHFTILPQPAFNYGPKDVWLDPRELAAAMDELIKAGPVFRLDDAPAGLVPAKTASFVISPWDAVWANLDRALAMLSDPYSNQDLIRRVLQNNTGIGNTDPQFWTTFLALMTSKGDRVALVPTLNGYWKDVASRPAWKEIAAGWCDWAAGGWDAWELHNNPDKYGKNKIWMGPVHTQDYRPYIRLYWEFENSLVFRDQWRGAIESGANWVQPVTWNDYGEGTEMSPSTGIQYSFYDLTAYYATWFKNLGKTPTPTVEEAQPKITQEVLYYFHRIHSITDPRMSFVLTTSTDDANTVSCLNGDRFYCPGGTNCPHGAGITIQTKPMCLRQGNEWNYDDIQVVMFIKSENRLNPGTVRMTVNGTEFFEHTITTQEYDDHHGIVPVSFSRKRANGTYLTGTLSFQLRRNNATVSGTAVDSAYPLVDSLPYQDLLVRSGSSTRAAIVP